MPSSSRRGDRSRGRIDGLRVRLVDDAAAGAVDLGHALRLLARMMVRAHQAGGDHLAIVPDPKPPLELTVSPTRRRVDSNEAA